MLLVKCVEKIRDNNGVITHYVLQDTNGDLKKAEACYVKEALKDGRISCVNLKISSDGRVISKKVKEEVKNPTISKVLIKFRALGVFISADGKFKYKDGIYSVHTNSGTISLDRCLVENGEFVIPQFVRWIYKSKMPFTDCVSLKSIDESQVTSYESIFMHCVKLKKVEIIKNDSVIITNTANMFVNCEGVEEIRLRINTKSNISTQCTVYKLYRIDKFRPWKFRYIKCDRYA